MQTIPNDVEQIIEEFTIKTKKILGNHLKQIILYGSYARGDFNENSDIDIMILIDTKDRELENYYEKIIELAYNIESKNNFKIHLSPLVKNIDKFNYWLDTIPFYMNVEKEGVVLNG